jgi:tetratricopeptide (TPR) repeat protein
MSPDNAQLIRVAKRLQQASGYLELGLTQQALDRLSGLGSLGPLEAEVALVRGEALRLQQRYADAATSLKSAALKFPPPFDRSAWLALSLCYRAAGNTEGADNSMGRARGAKWPKRDPR